MKGLIRQFLAAAAFLGLGAAALARPAALTTGNADLDAILIRDDEPQATQIEMQTAAQPVPEPTSVALLLLGAFAALTRRWNRAKGVAAIAACTGAMLLASNSAQAKLGGFEAVDGYSPPFSHDVWMYDAGQTGAPFTPPFYNTGRWAELFGSGNAGGDSQYISEHGYGGGGANVAPFALAVRCLSPSTDGSYNQQVRYSVGADDTGVSPSTPIISAQIDFDICPGATVIPSTGMIDNTFNNVPAFSLSFGGTNAAPGATIGFTDNDPSNGYKAEFFHNNGGTTVTQLMPWSGHFDHVTVMLNNITNTFDVSVTRDFNLITMDYDPGNLPSVVVLGASMTNPFSLLDNMYFRTHTDPGNGITAAGLEKSFLDNFGFQVVVPEPSSMLTMLVLSSAALLSRQRRRI